MSRKTLTQSEIDHIVEDCLKKIDNGRKFNTAIVLKDVILTNIVFNKVYIQNIMFQNVYFDNVKFLNTNMKGAVFYNCELNNVLFDSSKINEAMFNKTNLNSVNISYCDLTATAFKNVEFDEFSVQNSCCNKVHFREVNELGTLPADLVENEEIYFPNCILPRSFCKVSYQNTDIIYDSNNDIVLMYRPPKSISKHNHIRMSFAEFCKLDYFKNRCRQNIIMYFFTYGDEYLIKHVCKNDPEKIAYYMIQQGYEKVESDDTKICLWREDNEQCYYVTIPRKHITSRLDIVSESVPKDQIFGER